MTLKRVGIIGWRGMVGSVLYGMAQSALFSLLAVYAASMNFSIVEISIVTFLLEALSANPCGINLFLA